MTAALFQPTVWSWLFGAGIGTNLGASVICGVFGFAAGFAAGRGLWKKIRAHHQWQARQTATLMRDRGLEPEPHPHFDLSDKNVIRRGKPAHNLRGAS
jgi:hypothetical protein